MIFSKRSNQKAQKMADLGHNLEWGNLLHKSKKKIFSKTPGQIYKFNSSKWSAWNILLGYMKTSHVNAQGEKIHLGRTVSNMFLFFVNFGSMYILASIFSLCSQPRYFFQLEDYWKLVRQWLKKGLRNDIDRYTPTVHTGARQQKIAFLRLACQKRFFSCASRGKRVVGLLKIQRKFFTLFDVSPFTPSSSLKRKAFLCTIFPGAWKIMLWHHFSCVAPLIFLARIA